MFREVDVDEFQVGSDQGSAKAARTAGPGDVFGEDAGEGHEVDTELDRNRLYCFVLPT